MKKILIAALPAIVLVLAGCDTGPAGGSATPTQITPERQAEIDAHQQTVEDEERAHQATGS